MKPEIIDEGIAIRGIINDDAFDEVAADYTKLLNDIAENFWAYYPNMRIFDENAYMYTSEEYYDNKLARFVFRCYIEANDDGSLFLKEINAEAFYGF